MAYTLLDDPAPAAPKAKFTLIDDSLAESPTGSFTENLKAGAGKMMTDLARGVGQRAREWIEPSAFVKTERGLQRKPHSEVYPEQKTIADYLGLPRSSDIAESRRLDKPLMETGGGMVGNIGAGALAMAPAALAPGANTVVGAGLLGGAMGYTQPTVEGESPLKNAVIGEGVGAVAQAGAQKIGQVASGRLARKTQEAAQAQAANAPRDAILEASKKAGYVVPPASVNTGFGAELVESMGGKISTANSASLKNQGVTDKLARQYLGMADDAILSRGSLADASKVAAEPYRRVAALSEDAAAALKDWKQANFDAKMQWNYFRKSGNPEAYEKAVSLGATAEAALDKIEQEAVKATMGAGGLARGLVEDLKAARVRLGKLHTIESAMRTSGHVDAATIAKMGERFNLNGQLKTIADFATEFPKSVKRPDQIGGMSHMLRPGLGAGIGTMIGGPVGTAVGAGAGVAVPWSVREAILSRGGQSFLASPSYGVGLGTKSLAGLLDNLVTQAALPPATVGALLQYRAQQ